MTNNLDPSQSDNERSSNKHIRGSSLLFGGRLISIGLKSILQILIVRYLVKADYGAFAYALNFVEIAAIFMLVSLDQAASRFIPIYQETDDYDSIFGFIVMSIITILGLGISIIVVLISTQNLILGKLISDELTLTLLLLMLTLAPLQAIDSWFVSLFAAFSSVKAIFFRRYLLGPILQMLAVLLVIVTQSGIYLLGIGYIFTGIIGVSLYITLLSSLLRRKHLLERFRWQTLKFNPREIFTFSMPLLFSGLVFIFRAQLAVIFLEIFSGLEAVAEFRAVQPLAKLNSVVYGSFVFLYLPLATRMFARNDEAGINDLYWRTAAWISIASFPVFIVTFALSPEFVKILGEQYRTAAPIMAIMALGYYIHSIMGFNLHTLRAYGKIRFLVIMDFVVMVVAVLSYLVFIPLYGAVGGAVAFTIAIIVSNILNHIGLVRYTGVNLFNPTYLMVYLTLIGATAIILLVQIIFHPNLFISIPFTAIISLALLRLNAETLSVGETFPELMKIPGAKYLLKS